MIQVLHLVFKFMGLLRRKDLVFCFLGICFGVEALIEIGLYLCMLLVFSEKQ